MKRLILSLVLASIMLASMATAVLARPPVDLTPELRAAQAATAKYNAVAKALADGYVSTEECVAVPELGVMGIHYVNFGLVEAPPDPLKPAILLYVPRGDGFRLVGVEYFAAAIGYVPDETPPGPLFDSTLPDGWVWLSSAPVLFDQSMDGPMAGHGEEMPWHYDLHVWLWEENPSGMFAEFNPNLSCD